jgi:hypothetical protein
MKKRIVFTICMLISVVALHSQADMYPVTAADKAFFEKLRTAVLADDVGWLSRALDSYPFAVRSNAGEIKLKNENAFRQHFRTIFNDQMKEIVRTQSPDSLFKNWQGIMIGNGEIWFSELGETNHDKTIWVQRIIAINLAEDPLKIPSKGR